MDTMIIKLLMDTVFNEYFNEADPKLKVLGKKSSAFVYTNCVLFPETFIHQHETQGKSREEAEQAFMEVAVDAEERQGLEQEIQEAKAERKQSRLSWRWLLMLRRGKDLSRRSKRQKQRGSRAGFHGGGC